MVRDCPRLRRKVHDTERGGKQAKTVLQKSFPGGMLMMVGSNTPSALASTPARYIIGDERDRWALSAGREGDPWRLAEARQTTFYNAKAIEVSTPTVKGASNIEDAYASGTQERWVTRCPECGEWHGHPVRRHPLQVRDGPRKRAEGAPAHVRAGVAVPLVRLPRVGAPYARGAEPLCRRTTPARWRRPACAASG